MAWIKIWKACEKGKTETKLFGATKRFKTAGKIDVLYNNQRISFTET